MLPFPVNYEQFPGGGEQAHSVLTFVEVLSKCYGIIGKYVFLYTVSSIQVNPNRKDPNSNNSSDLNNNNLNRNLSRSTFPKGKGSL